MDENITGIDESEDEPPLLHDRYKANSLVSLRSTPGKGKGIFASSAIPKDTMILKFQGPLLTTEEVRNIGHDHFIQIDDDLWLGPSGLADDYVNHSCNPNSVLINVSTVGASSLDLRDEDTKSKLKSEIALISIEDIDVGEEITFDYSPYMTDEEPIGPCRCGSGPPPYGCRGMIDMYQNLDPRIQERYEAIEGFVPDFAIRARIKKEKELKEAKEKEIPKLFLIFSSIFNSFRSSNAPSVATQT